MLNFIPLRYILWYKIIVVWDSNLDSERISSTNLVRSTLKLVPNLIAKNKKLF